MLKVTHICKIREKRKSDSVKKGIYVESFDLSSLSDLPMAPV